MAKNYESVIIFSPVLSDEDVKKSIERYKKFLKKNDAEIIEELNWGLRQLAYPIKGKSNGIYFIFEFKSSGELPHKFEIELKRDESILRFMTVSLDKYAIDYNERKRKGLVGKKKNQELIVEPSIEA